MTLEQAVDEMKVAGAAAAGADREPAGHLRLGTGAAEATHRTHRAKALHRPGRVGFTQVVTGGKMLAFAGEDDHPHVVVMGGGIERLIQLVQQLGILRIGALRPVQADAGDARFGDFIDEGFEAGVGHRCLLG